MTLALQNPLAADQVERYRSEGFLVVPDVLTPAEVDAFLDHHQRPRPPEWQLGLRTHTVDLQWRSVAMHPSIVGRVRQLLDGPPMIVQTMYLNKSVDGGKGIALHQDSYYIQNEPNTLMACWVAMVDTSAENGGLCVIPGSHLQGLRSSRQNSDTVEHAAWETVHTLRDRDGQESQKTIHAAVIEDLDPASIIRLSVPRGAGVFFTGLTIHGSFANHSTDRPRPAFATHYVRQDTWVYRTDITDVVPAA